MFDFDWKIGKERVGIRHWYRKSTRTQNVRKKGNLIIKNSSSRRYLSKENIQRESSLYWSHHDFFSNQIMYREVIKRENVFWKWRNKQMEGEKAWIMLKYKMESKKDIPAKVESRKTRET